MVYAGCEEDSTEKVRVGLLGRWELFKGYRNRQQTETLAGIYFEFNGDKTMKTNLPLVPETQVEYELSKNTIYQKGLKPLKYEIKELADSVLVLTMVLRGMPFELHLRKVLPPLDSIQNGMDFPPPDSPAEVIDTPR